MLNYVKRTKKNLMIVITRKEFLQINYIWH